MRIQLNEKFAIVSRDKLNIELQELKLKKDKDGNAKEPAWETIGYYGTLPQAVSGCLHHGIMGEDLEGIKSVNATLEAMAELIIEQMELVADTGKDDRDGSGKDK